MNHKTTFFALLVSIALHGQKQEVNLGNMKVDHHVNDTTEIREFYRNILGFKLVTPDSPVPRDYVEFSNGFRLNIIYQRKDVPSNEDFMNGLWLRIHVADFATVAERVRKSGVKIIHDKVDKDEIYFQALGGQVYRMGKLKSN